jgi:hypothetical protein
VGASTPTPPVGCLDTNIYILAIDPSNMSSVAQADVAITATTYNVLEVPAGSYYLVAGTDCDMNDLICDQDKDYCGIYPLDSGPQTVDIAAQQFTSGLNLNVSKVTARAAAAPDGTVSALMGRSFRKIAKK